VAAVVREISASPQSVAAVVREISATAYGVAGSVMEYYYWRCTCIELLLRKCIELLLGVITFF
jgi:hypothetical protein